jgi:cytochrome c553
MKNSHFYLMPTLLLLLSCGKGEGETIPQNTPSETNAGVLTKGLFRVVEHTVEKSTSPIDYLMLLEPEGNWRYGFFQGRFSDAIQTLTARLGFMGATDWNFAIAPSAVRVQQGNNPLPAVDFEKNGLYVTTGSTTGVVLKSTPEFDKVISYRAEKSRAPNFQYRPISALKKVLDNAELNNFPRRDSKLSVFFAGTSDEQSEKLEIKDAVDLLNQKKGEGKWSLTVFTVPTEGCTYGDNADKIGVTPNGETDDDRHLLAKLGALPAAQFLSVCENSYNSFFEKYISDKGNSSEILIQLSDKAMWDSIKVTANNVAIYGWKYNVGETKIIVPGHFQTGVKIKVSYEVDWGKRENTVDTLKYSPPTLVRKKLSPEEKEFQDEIDPILSGSCGNCHGGGGAQKQYPGSFKNFTENKSGILDRVKRQSGAAGFMPQGGTALSAEQIQKFEAFYSKYGF